MKKVIFVSLTAMISLSMSAVGQDKGKVETAPVKKDRFSNPATVPFGGAETLFQSAKDLRAASESLAQFGESLQNTTANISGMAEAVAEHLAQMSSGFDPLGLQNAFKTVQEQSEVIRQQQEIIFKLQHEEIQRLRRENRQLKMVKSGGKSEARKKKKKRTEP